MIASAGRAARITALTAFSASRSAAVAKSPPDLSNRASGEPNMARTTAAPASAAATATSASVPAFAITRAA
jgi:hypothetical protein